jgi:RNA polymerase sigma-70 factor (ECF subfamily)
MVPGDREPGLSVAIDAEIALREAVRRLDRIDREILLLREYEELSYLEIAVVLAIPVNTVRSRLFRARMALRDLLTAPAASAKAQPLSKREEHA